MSTVKSQHYIPEALLKNFTNTDGKFFEVLLNNKKIYPTTPSNSMCETFVYEHELLEKNTVERYFVKIENEAIPQIRELLVELESLNDGSDNFSSIKAKVNELLPIYITFYYRSGALLTEFSSMDSKDKIPLLSKKILNRQYINLLSQTIRNGYKFSIIKTRNSFVLSDQFVSTAALKIKSQFINASNRHIGLKETIILLPISSTYYAVYWHTDGSFILGENMINELDENGTKMINQAIINNSYIKAVCNNKEILAEVVANYHMEYPSQTFVGHATGRSSGFIKKKEVFFYEIDREAYMILSHMIKIKEYMEAERNDPCPCGSDKKFKKCHLQIIDRIRIPFQGFSQHENPLKYNIPNVPVGEAPIDEWGPMAQG